MLKRHAYVFTLPAVILKNDHQATLVYYTVYRAVLT
jgi:hypothetical protein